MTIELTESELDELRDMVASEIESVCPAGRVNRGDYRALITDARALPAASFDDPSDRELVLRDAVMLEKLLTA